MFSQSHHPPCYEGADSLRRRAERRGPSDARGRCTHPGDGNRTGTTSSDSDDRSFRFACLLGEESKTGITEGEEVQQETEEEERRGEERKFTVSKK
eukprot:752297-Hanusia_phi.AAC.5